MVEEMPQSRLRNHWYGRRNGGIFQSDKVITMTSRGGTQMKKRYVVQIGMGVDQHGHENNPTTAAIRAVKDAISNNCLPGIVEIVGLKRVEEMIVDVLIAAPFPEKMDENEVLSSIPFGTKALTAVKGGMVTQGLAVEALNDTDGAILVANASVTVSFEME
jgi:uncharacterized protein (TIGR02058 family)